MLFLLVALLVMCVWHYRIGNWDRWYITLLCGYIVIWLLGSVATVLWVGAVIWFGWVLYKKK